jgi:DNA-binding CsgD family transcriptional regulator
LSPQYDWRDLAATAAATDPATKHRPTEREVLLREALRLRAQGLQPRDIGELLGLNPSVVESLIEGNEPGSGSV